MSNRRIRWPFVIEIGWIDFSRRSHLGAIRRQMFTKKSDSKRSSIRRADNEGEKYGIQLSLMAMMRRCSRKITTRFARRKPRTGVTSSRRGRWLTRIGNGRLFASPFKPGESREGWRSPWTEAHRAPCEHTWRYSVSLIYEEWYAHVHVHGDSNVSMSRSWLEAVSSFSMCKIPIRSETLLVFNRCMCT